MNFNKYEQVSNLGSFFELTKKTIEKPLDKFEQITFSRQEKRQKIPIYLTKEFNNLHKFLVIPFSL